MLRPYNLKQAYYKREIVKKGDGLMGHKKKGKDCENFWESYQKYKEKSEEYKDKWKKYKGKDKDKSRKFKRKYEKYWEQSEEYRKKYLTCKGRDEESDDLIFNPIISVPTGRGGGLGLFSGISVVVYNLTGALRVRSVLNSPIRLNEDLADARRIWGFPIFPALPAIDNPTINGVTFNFPNQNQLPDEDDPAFTMMRQIREQQTAFGSPLDPRVVTVWYAPFFGITSGAIGRAYPNVPALNFDPQNPVYYQHIILTNRGASGGNNSLFAHELGHILFATALGLNREILNDPTDPTSLGTSIHSADEIALFDFIIPNPNVMNAVPNNKTILVSSQLEKASRSYLFPENIPE